MREDFHLPLDALGTLLFSLTAGYTLSSFFSGALVRRFGIGMLIAISSGVSGLTLIGYTLISLWWFIPVLGFFTGLGSGAVDAGLNTYAAHNFSESLMQWLHASFGIGLTIGPLIMTAGLTFSNRWHIGYQVVGSTQILLAVCFAFSRNLWKSNDSSTSHAAGDTSLSSNSVSLTKTFRCTDAWISVVMFFIYSGIETSLGLWAYTLLTESRGIEHASAGLLTGSFWAMFTVGRIFAGFYAKRLKADTILLGSTLLALIGAVLLWLAPSSWVSIAGIIIIGFAIAPVFPAMVSATAQRVGKEHVNNTIGMQIAGAGIGGATLPTLAGTLARTFSLEVIPIYLVGNIIVLLLIQRIISYRQTRN